MKISTKGRYALKIMIDIAMFGETENVSITDISKRQEISVKYLEQIIGLLTKSKLLISSRGANGGYKLAKGIKEITVGEVLESTEGKVKMSACIGTGMQCDKASSCFTMGVWNKLNEVINNFLYGITLEDVINKNY